MGPHVCFVLVLVFVSVFLGWCSYELGIFHANQTAGCLGSRGGAGDGGWSTAGWLGPRVIFIVGLPRRLFCFGSLVILGVARCYLWLFALYVNIKIGKMVVEC